MRKRFFITFMSFCIILMLSPVFAMDFMVGAKAGYFMWRPYFKDVETGFFQDIENGVGALYGPVASVIFNDKLSFSGVALFGTQQAHWSLDNSFNSDESKYTNGTYFIESDRIDVDSALSYRLLGNLKLFAGYKYQLVKSTLKITEQQSQFLDDSELMAYKEASTITVVQHGPALGAGYSYPFGGNMFVSANVSAIYMWGSFKVKTDSVKYDGTTGFNADDVRNDDEHFDLDTSSFGMNLEPVFGVRINQYLVLTIGARYQWLRIDVKDFDEDPQNGMNDHLVGGFLSVLFVF